jgi:APA family basic amino acid/polyamine antiporter
LTELLRQLRARDAIFVNVGTMIGSGVFVAATPVAQALGFVPLQLLVWVVAAAVSLLGALTIAELAAALPRAGGMFVYLREAYGPLWGYLYGWAECAVILPAGNAAVAVLFAAYLGRFVPLSPRGESWVAVACIAGLTLINVIGVKAGVRTQNAMTVLKMILLAALAVLCFSGRGNLAHLAAGPPRLGGPVLLAFGAALLQPLWAFDGWVYASCLGGELIRPERALPFATIGAVAIVAALYLAVNASFLYILGPDAAARSQLIAADAAQAVLGRAGAGFASGLVMLAVLGSLAGGVISGPRVLYAMAKDGLFWRAAGRVHPRFGTPAVAILLLGIWSAVLVFTGRYDQLLTYALFASWLFYALGAAAVPVLRRRQPDLPRPFRAWGYPVVPLLFVLFSLAFLLYTVVTDRRDAAIGAALVAAGLVPFVLWRRRRKPT